MHENHGDVLKYVEKVMNEDRFFNELKMVLSAGYITAYLFIQKGETAKAKKVVSVLENLARDCSPFIERSMNLIKECRGDRDPPPSGPT